MIATNETLSKTPPTRRRRKGLLANPHDIHCVVFHLGVLASYALAFWLWLHPQASGLDSTPDRVAFVLAAGLLLGWISGIDVGVNFHNHTHRRIFTKPWLNRWFGRLWTFSGGWPSYYWNHAHVVVHHANLLRDPDWTLPKRKPDGSFESIYSYILLHWPWRYAVHLWQDFRSGRAGRRAGKRAVKEGLLFLALWSIPFWIDPVMGLVLWLWPQWVGNAITMGSGMYVQHAGGRAKTKEAPVSHSNTFLSRFFNLTMFNIGYHIEHHDHPHVHWSELPLFHERTKSSLIEGGGHVVPYGYYQAASLCSRPPKPTEGVQRFVRAQAPGYERQVVVTPARRPSPAPEHASHAHGSRPQEAHAVPGAPSPAATERPAVEN